MGTAEYGEAWQTIQPDEESALTFALGFDRAVEGDLGTQKEGTAHRHSKHTPLWRAKSATEQNAVGFVVPNEEKEGVVCTEPWPIFKATFHNISGRGSCGLRAFLVHLHKCLVHKLGQTQVSLG